MKIAIIGAGFTGLSAAFELVKKNHDVSVFEKDQEPGGLAVGYREKEWNWSLEKHYHHWFTNDNSVLDLAKEINHDVIIKRPKTSVFTKNKIYQLDSPLTVLKFPLLSFFERLKMSAVIGFLKYDPFWKTLEKYKASVILPKLMGKKTYEMIWEPLFINKFGKYAENVSLAWFWARIKKRTPSLAYPKGGFLNFAQELVKQIEKMGGRFYFNTQVQSINDDGKKAKLTFSNDLNHDIKEDVFDKIIITLPSFMFLKIAPQLPIEYKNSLGKLKGLGATNLILRLNKPFLNDDTYWLNVCDKNAPVMAVVEHTNFMDKKYYNNEHLLYLGNYLPADSKRFAMEKEEVLRLFDPFLRKINPDYKKSLIGYQLFKAPFAQPIIPINYSKMIPPMITPLKNVFLANIEQVYPWDRGTNYAVELGQKVVKFIENE